ncbi:hypothetical protein KUTeg_020929 [Tegillarca granosa]|uniref:DDE Tnp4 domain-containing protein n=1 Tax=Tegillarca granosa TaxID=220873 RepID=A0ABQ9E9E8_TEGGR|nr:hypothetical protein KUTeg_020929 [Tegillarca granosa]
MLTNVLNILPFPTLTIRYGIRSHKIRHDAEKTGKVTHTPRYRHIPFTSQDKRNHQYLLIMQRIEKGFGKLHWIKQSRVSKFGQVTSLQVEGMSFQKITCDKKNKTLHRIKMNQRTFPCLRKKLAVKLETTFHIIVACAVLYNLRKNWNLTIPDDSSDDICSFII